MLTMRPERGKETIEADVAIALIGIVPSFDAATISTLDNGHSVPLVLANSRVHFCRSLQLSHSVSLVLAILSLNYTTTLF